MQRSEKIPFNNNFNMFGGSHNLFSYFLVDNRHASTHIYKDKVIQLVSVDTCV